jgi:TonB family protein
MARRPYISPVPRISPAADAEQLRLPAEEVHPRPGMRGAESDIAELFAKFEENSGGTLSPQFSAELALEIVLNQIVERACLATGATGAAVVLRRGEDLVCRASNGSSAPNLGVQMDAHSGLSGLCMQTGQRQRCDDTHSDPRADAQASRRLGVRSVIVLPLAQSAGTLGIFEVLSTRPEAFTERDELTLEALARRVLRNVERAAEPFLLRADALAGTDAAAKGFVEAFVEPRPVVEPEPVLQAEIAPPRINPPHIDPVMPEPAFQGVVEEAKTSRGIDLITWVMGLILLVGMVVFGFLTGRRFGWSVGRSSAQSAKVSTHVVSAQVMSAQAMSSQTAPKQAVTGAPPASARDAVASIDTADPVATAKLASDTSRGPSAPATPSATVADGGLRVYDNGREVFRLPESSGRKAAVTGLPSTTTEAIVLHRVEPEYPEQARARQLQGKVVLKVRIHPDGTVGDVELVNGDPLLAQAAIHAVRQWRFKPAAENGDLAEMQTQVTMNFRLPQ